MALQCTPIGQFSSVQCSYVVLYARILALQIAARPLQVATVAIESLYKLINALCNDTIVEPSMTYRLDTVHKLKTTNT